MKPQPRTNIEFLKAIFPQLCEGEGPLAWATEGIPGELGRSCLATVWPVHANPVDPDLSWRFTLANFRARSDQAARHRVKNDVLDARGICIWGNSVLSMKDLIADLPPSYLIDGGRCGAQAVYLFPEPCLDLGRIEALAGAFRSAGLTKATNPLSLLNSWMPFGVAFEQGSPIPTSTSLLIWQPERRYLPETLKDKLARRSSAGQQQGTRSSAKAPEPHFPTNPDQIYLRRPTINPVVRALTRLRLYDRPVNEGEHRIACPWCVQRGVDPKSAPARYRAPSPDEPYGGFACESSSCAAFGIEDFLALLGVGLEASRFRAAIFVLPGELAVLTNAAERVLANQDYYFQRSGSLVVLDLECPNASAIQQVTQERLLLDLSKHAVWLQPSRGQKALRPTNPQLPCVRALWGAGQYNHLRELRAVARQPFLRDDESLCCNSGYDASSKVYGLFDSKDFAIRSSVSLDEAKASVKALDTLLDEFEFVCSADRSAALAGMLTAAIRSTLHSAPMFHARASQPGSGKSYLCELISSFADASPAPAMTMAPDDAECTKSLTAALMTAPAALMFDNLTTDLEPFQSLCSVLTSSRFKGRILGSSATVEVSTATLFLSNGNHVGPVRDMARRCVTIGLGSKQEFAAERRFQSSPLHDVLTKRAKFVTHALIVVQAYLCAGAPNQPLRSLAGYDMWTRRVRSPLVWLGWPDPAGSLFESMKFEPSRQDVSNLLKLWFAVFGPSPTGVADLVHHAEMISKDAPELHDALLQLAEVGGSVNRRRLGKKIANNQGRVIDGMRLEPCDAKLQGSSRWQLRLVTEAE